MKIKLKVKKILEIHDALNRVWSYPKAPYGGSRSIKSIKTVIENYYQDRIDLQKHFCELDEFGDVKIVNGKTIPLPGKEKEANDELNRIESEEIEIEVYEILRSKFENSEIPGIYLAPLEDIILVDQIG